MGSLHTSKIGNLLPACLRNNRFRNNQISEQQATFGENWLRIADVFVQQLICGQTQTETKVIS